MTKIIWKAVEGFPYSVSNTGLIRRDADEANTFKGRILSQRTDKDGYIIVTLHCNGQRKDKKLHSLICSAFNGYPKEGQDQVRHLDGNKQNNKPENLVWGSAKENAFDRDIHGKTARGEKHSVAHFTNKFVQELRKEYFQTIKEHGEKYIPKGWLTDRAKELGLSRVVLNQILRGRGYH